MSSGSVTQEPIYSTYRDDEDLRELVALFVAEMPNRVTSLQSAYEADNWEDVCRIAHQLKGASGSYGFEQLTLPAGRLEKAVRDQAEADEISSALTTLVSICHRLR